jgi:alpha-tubulin suppressor-like RCC1 family protein
LNKKVVDVACGRRFFMVLTNELKNNLYTCGLNSYGQLGINSECNKSELQNVGLSECSALLNKRIVKIACGRDFSFALTDDGHLYATGRNNKGQLGLDSTCSKDKFTHVRCDVVDIAAGYRHSLMLTNELTNNLYSTGSNSDGQLGLNHEDGYCEYETTFQNVGSSSIIVDTVEVFTELLNKQILKS